MAVALVAAWDSVSRDMVEWSFCDKEDSWVATRVGQGSRLSTIEDAVREATGRVVWLTSALGFG